MAAGRPVQYTICYLHGRRCGFYGDATRECRCTPAQIQNYLGKIGGPLLDRIDIHAEVPAVPFQELRGEAKAEPSAAIRERVLQARAVQQTPRGHQRPHAQPLHPQTLRPRRFRRAHLIGA